MTYRSVNLIDESKIDLRHLRHVVPAVPIGIPSERARRRPDIREAEVRLHQATAEVGVEQDLSDNVTGIGTTLVALYKAVGGGWESTYPEAASANVQ
jgi:outer membrane protein TolC